MSLGAYMLAYDQLQGASGRQRRFRAPRYDAKRLFPNAVPRVRVRAGTYRLHDVSLGGIAALAKDSGGELVRQGETVDLSIQQSGIPIFEASASVCRLENSVFGSKVAFSLLDRHIDLGRLLTRNAQAQLAARSSALAAAAAHPLSVEYRAFCADVVRLLRSYGAILDDATKVAREFGSALTDLEIFEPARHQSCRRGAAFGAPAMSWLPRPEAIAIFCKLSRSTPNWW